MGSAIVVALSKLPDELDLATAQRILGDRFDQAVFDRLKDADGYLPKDALLAAVQEKEASLQEGEAAPEVQTEEDEEDDGLTEPQRVAARARAVAEKARDLWMVRLADLRRGYPPYCVILTGSTTSCLSGGAGARERPQWRAKHHRRPRRAPRRGRVVLLRRPVVRIRSTRDRQPLMKESCVKARPAQGPSWSCPTACRLTHVRGRP